MKPLPSYASIDGRKVKIYHIGQKRTCARCQKDGENCPGRANAKQCDENGGTKTNVEVAWKEILNAMGYTEWKGGETVVENSENGEKEETVAAEEVTPIEGCDGLVFDNLEETTTLEDIKTILKGVCTDESMISCTLHPTGSLRSKILKNLDTSLIPSVAKKIDKKSYKGRLIFCKPYVPKTPKKETNPTDMQENPPAIRNEQETTLETNPKPIITGLTEADRLKAVKPKEKKNRKPKQRKSKTIDAGLDIKCLRQDYRKYTIPTDLYGKVFPTGFDGKSFPTGELGKIIILLAVAISSMSCFLFI